MEYGDSARMSAAWLTYELIQLLNKNRSASGKRAAQADSLCPAPSTIVTCKRFSLNTALRTMAASSLTSSTTVRLRSGVPASAVPAAKNIRSGQTLTLRLSLMICRLDAHSDGL